jgi:F-type H+-transporting ATPase subunit a
MGLLALDFPPISHLTIWRDLGGGINKTVLIYFLAVVLTLGLFFLAGRKKALVPSGMQGIAESSIDFVRNQIIMPTMGVDGMVYLPFLATMFFFILFSNITEIIPFIQFPANARIAMPLTLALLTWVLFNVVGVVKQGGLHYLLGIAFPPGVPKALYVLVTPIELVSVFIVRPLSLSVRLFANMLAGHLILVTFAVLCSALWTAKVFSLIILPFPFLLLIAMTGFEILVSFLQAFIFTILTAVYIGGSMHPEH